MCVCRAYGNYKRSSQLSCNLNNSPVTFPFAVAFVFRLHLMLGANLATPQALYEYSGPFPVK